MIDWFSDHRFPLIGCPGSYSLELELSQNLDFRILDFQNLEFRIWDCQNLEFRILAFLKNSEFWLSKILNSGFWLSKILNSGFWISKILNSGFWHSLALTLSHNSTEITLLLVNIGEHVDKIILRTVVFITACSKAVHY